MMDEWILSLQTILNASTLWAKKEKNTLTIVLGDE